MTQDTKLTNLWELLQTHKVVIPNFQRDYAQGREGKSDLRKRFLEQIRTNLKSNNTLTLDFVYGTKNENGQIEPLDGQQRLTTIWLLMWYAVYLNYDAKKYDNELGEKLKILKRFSYETRDSSKSFIEWLCAVDNGVFGDSSKGSLSSRIQNCNGFHAVWRQDPTVQSILRMLSGTGNEDGIELVFKEWENLNKLFCIGGDNPIQFYYLDLDGIKQSNNLYIKMNARGEQLTGFENFKADLVSHFREEVESLRKYVTPDNEDYILTKWDVDWTDLFWENRSGRGAIDNLFFSFIKRFIFNYSIIKSYKLKEDVKKLEEEVKELEKVLKRRSKKAKENELNKDDFKEQIENIKKNIENKKQNIENIEGSQGILFYDAESKKYIESKEYTSFDHFGELIDEECIKGLIKVLDNAKKIHSILNGDKKGIVPPLLENYCFLPRYENETYDENSDTKLVVKDVSFYERVMMYGVCQYLIYAEKFEENNFAHWLRVLANLVYYNEIAKDDIFASRLRFVDEVVELCLNEDKVFTDPYIVLPTQYEKNKEKTTANYEQLKEEITKINLIKGNNNIEDTLKKLESLWIFEGRIECLLGKDVLELDNLYEKLKELLGDESNGGNLRSANETLRDLFRAILTKVDIDNIPDEMLFNNEHNRFRIYLNEVLKEPFIEVVKEIISGESSTGNLIQNYKYEAGDWKYALVKDPNLWDYAEKGKYKKRGAEYYWCYKLKIHERDIPLISYSRFISENENGVPKGIEFTSKDKGWEIEYKDEKKRFTIQDLL